jgi:hypothetical protein
MTRSRTFLTVIGIASLLLTVLVLNLSIISDVSADSTFQSTKSQPPGFTYIPNVPDWNQPARSGMTNVCAPVSALNILNYYDPWGFSLYPGLIDPSDSSFYVNFQANSATADLIAYFMGTNGVGSPARINNSTLPIPGTHYMDQDTGLAEYIRWTHKSQFHPADPEPPSWKRGYGSEVKLYDILSSSVTKDTLWKYFIAEIDAGRPAKIDFKYWNPIFDNDTFFSNNDTFYMYSWGDTTSSSSDPPEEWGEHVGHAVTGVGYIPNWNGSNWAVVHDNWPMPVTHENVVIPWDSLMALITVSKPGLLRTRIDQRIPIPPGYGNHCIATNWDGLGPPGYMGIWSASHAEKLYFPSDTIEIADRPKAYLEPGIQIATVYGTGTAEINMNPIVPIPDRYNNSCTLFIHVPDMEYMDEATDFNAIRISEGDMTVIPIEDTVETMVFLAACDGDGDYSSDQPLQVTLNYEDASSDIVLFEDIHPAGRGDITNPGEIFLFDNEVFICSPAYFDHPSPYYDAYHSEAWHWYAIYPENDKMLSDIMFEGIQTGENSDIYIFSLSYSSRESQVGDQGGYWRFEEGSGDIAYDESDNHNDGDIRGASWVVPGECFSNYALEFHGGGQFYDGDRVAVPHSPSVDITGEITVSAWIKATGSDDYLAIVDKYFCSPTDIAVGFTMFLSAGRLRFMIYSGSNGAQYCLGTSELRDNTLHHVAGVWDGNYIRVYVDGQPENEIPWDYPPASTVNELGIGERTCGWGGYMPFLGTIDEVNLYSRALTDPEIEALACQCIPGDANNDCQVNVGDAVYLISYVFKGGPPPTPYGICSGDANCDCQVNVGDAVYIISYVFKGGPGPCDCETWISYCGSLHK